MSLPVRSTIQNYDGQTKQNDQQQPPAIQSLNWDNTKLGRCVGDVAALGLTAPRIWVRMTLSSTTGGLVLLNWFSLWSNATFNQPVLANTGTGVFTITLPSIVNDEYDASFGNAASVPVILSGGYGNIEGANFGTEIHVSATSSNVLTVYTGLSGSANNLSGKSVSVVGF